MMLALDGAWNKFNAKKYPFRSQTKYNQLTLDVFRGCNHMTVRMSII